MLSAAQPQQDGSSFRTHLDYPSDLVYATHVGAGKSTPKTRLTLAPSYSGRWARKTALRVEMEMTMPMRRLQKEPMAATTNRGLRTKSKTWRPSPGNKPKGVFLRDGDPDGIQPATSISAGAGVNVVADWQRAASSDDCIFGWFHSWVLFPARTWAGTTGLTVYKYACCSRQGKS